MDRYEMANKLEQLLDSAETAQIMKDIEGYEGLYAITPSGQVWSYRRKKFLSPGNNGCGYWFVCLRKDGKSKHNKVHRLVAEAYIPKPDYWTPGMKLDVGHKDNNPSNNDVSNLYWCTRSENLDTDHFREAVKTKIFSKVRCVETGEVFKSMIQAGEAISRHHYGINLCLLGKQNTCGGYHWERVYEEV